MPEVNITSTIPPQGGCHGANIASCDSVIELVVRLTQRTTRREHRPQGGHPFCVWIALE